MYFAFQFTCFPLLPSDLSSERSFSLGNISHIQNEPSQFESCVTLPVCIAVVVYVNLEPCINHLDVCVNLVNQCLSYMRLWSVMMLDLTFVAMGIGKWLTCTLVSSLGLEIVPESSRASQMVPQAATVAPLPGKVTLLPILVLAVALQIAIDLELHRFWIRFLA